jgi:hypothetical protein
MATPDKRRGSATVAASGQRINTCVGSLDRLYEFDAELVGAGEVAGGQG